MATFAVTQFGAKPIAPRESKSASAFSGSPPRSSAEIAEVRVKIFGWTSFCSIAPTKARARPQFPFLAVAATAADQETTSALSPSTFRRSKMSIAPVPSPTAAHAPSAALYARKSGASPAATMKSSTCSVAAPDGREDRSSSKSRDSKAEKWASGYAAHSSDTPLSISVRIFANSAIFLSCDSSCVFVGTMTRCVLNFVGALRRPPVGATPGCGPLPGFGGPFEAGRPPPP
mmetsp:Transcript_32331/g.80499  ORF Transcript_32331/g.80499 Transcript_32331/m.80499 type:complete len:231 (-) Transcript_32331:184-876(-)